MRPSRRLKVITIVGVHGKSAVSANSLLSCENLGGHLTSLKRLLLSDTEAGWSPCISGLAQISAAGPRHSEIVGYQLRNSDS